jgi:bifunctional DNA-binding transcriptional regulator/antitoxin component of YhaV-PrlF toxin-antitoxin module
MASTTLTSKGQMTLPKEIATASTSSRAIASMFRQTEIGSCWSRRRLD